MASIEADGANIKTKPNRRQHQCRLQAHEQTNTSGSLGCGRRSRFRLRMACRLRHCNCHGMANVYEIIIQYRPNQIAGREPRREINSHTNPSINKDAGKHAGPMTNMKCWAFLACGIILNLWNLLHAKWASLCAPACNSILTQINRRASGPMVC